MVDDSDSDRRARGGSGDALGDTLGAPLQVAAAAVAPFAANVAASQPTLAVGPPLYDAPIRFDLAPTARYRLGHLVGRGGMGEVRLAYDDQLGREVAVKRIRGEAEPSTDQIARFVREARVQGWLEHPAVVPVHDIAVDADGRPFFVMKRLAGTEMSELLDRMRSGREADPAASRRRMLRAFADVCLAIEFAHSRGVIHRDLKPANIMLGDFGEVYVLDWGIARATAADAGRPERGGDYDPTATGQTQVGTILGTPAYMAPEQLAGQRVGAAADIYALGCVLYEIAAGATLHPATRGVADAYRTVETRPSVRWPECPPEIDAICERACAIDPGERYSSARALHIAIQAFLEGDRDVAARAELARHHISIARAARASGDGEAARQAAMRAAGRALALDPTATEAADVVTELMLTPPKTIPRAVHERMEAIDLETGRAQGKMGAIAISGYLGFVPLLVWTGVRDVALVIAFAIAALVSAVQIYWMTRSDRIPTRSIYVSAAINAVLIGVVSRIVGPFIIAPTLVVTMLMAYAVHPRFGAMPIVAALLTAGVAIPWALELAGVVEPTYHFVNGAIVLTSPAIAFTSVPVQLAFAVMLVLLVAIVALLLRTMATRQHEATRQIELHAWHLRQVVPTAGR